MLNVIEHLRNLHQHLSLELNEVPRTDHENLSRLIGMMSEIDIACKRLDLCEKWRIFPKSIVRALPAQKCESGSSDYRIMEDCETENRPSWMEADFDGRTHRFNAGDLVIQP
jgi:hypothetical protein